MQDKVRLPLLFAIFFPRLPVLSSSLFHALRFCCVVVDMLTLLVVVVDVGCWLTVSAQVFWSLLFTQWMQQPSEYHRAEVRAAPCVSMCACV